MIFNFLVGVNSDSNSIAKNELSGISTEVS